MLPKSESHYSRIVHESSSSKISKLPSERNQRKNKKKTRLFSFSHCNNKRNKYQFDNTNGSQIDTKVEQMEEGTANRRDERTQKEANETTENLSAFKHNILFNILWL